MDDKLVKLLKERAKYETQNLELAKEIENAKLEFQNANKGRLQRASMNRKCVKLVTEELKALGYEEKQDPPAVADDQPGDVQQVQ